MKSDISPSSEKNTRSKAQEKLMREMGNRLTEIRTINSNMKQDQMIRFFDLKLDFNIITSKSTLSRYENGLREIPLLLCLELRNKLGIDLNWFIAGDNPVSKEQCLPPEIQDHIRALASYFKDCHSGNRSCQKETASDQ